MVGNNEVTMRATTMSAGLAAIVALSLGGCGGVEVGTGDAGSGSDGLAQDTAVLGSTAVDGVADTRGDRSADLDSSRSDGGVDAPASDATVDGKACGTNPAEVCPTSPGQCVPSSCFCSDGVWGCTADCTSGARNCVDAGTGKPDGARSGVPCGSGFCTDGNYCCNANCGTCAPMGALCIQIACQPPLTWACASDADCRLMDDYCTSCDCRALGPGGTLATCTGPGVQCFVAGCFNKVPRCVEGQCVAAAKATN
jgi:hypothetical protein